MSANNLTEYAACKQPFTVFIEGNIGSGKTTFLNHFNKFHDDICLITEPVEKWRNCNGVNLLELMYNDPHRWAMTFQTYVTLTMLQSHTKQTEKKVKLMERSMYSARFCFVENLHKTNTIQDGMYEVLKEWYNFITESIHIQADLIGRQINPMATRKLSKYGTSVRPFTVFIEGNIGSGKTTFLNHFNKFKHEICLLTEPVEKWRNCNGVNLLELMYSDPDRWAMPFQTYVTLTMLQSHTMPTEKKIKLMERSLFSARFCFVENMQKNKTLNEGMVNILNEWYKFIDQTIHIQADLIVYLRTSPEVVHERIKKRARPEEMCVPLKYLQELHELHEDWLVRNKRGPKIPLLILDGDLDLEHIGIEYKRSEERIINFASNESQKYECEA